MATIGELFRGMRGAQPVVNNNPTAHPAGQPVPPQNQQDVKAPLNNPNANPTQTGVPPTGTSNPTNQTEPISPMDQFKDLWKTPATDGKNPDPFSQPLLTTDPVKLQEAARKMNFAQNLDPAKVQKALGGDPASFMELINEAAQNAFVASTTLNSNMVEGATKTNNSRLDSVMEKKFKEFMVAQQRSDNPVLQHAAVAPILELAKKQLTSQHPHRSAEEIQQMAETYVTNFADTFQGQKTAAQQKQDGLKADPNDFSSWG